MGVVGYWGSAGDGFSDLGEITAKLGGHLQLAIGTFSLASIKNACLQIHCMTSVRERMAWKVR